MSGPSLVDFRWGWDEAIFRAVNAEGSSWLDAVWVAASSRLFGVATLVAFAAWLLARLKRGALVPLAQLAGAAALTDAFGARVLKPAIGRMRPSFALPDHLVRVLLPAADVGSMPSLHSANAFAVATAVTLTVPRAGWVAFPVALLIGASRVGVGVHWPSDVLAGAVYGAVVGAAIVFGSRGALSRAAGVQARSQPPPASGA
ncbi:MAG: phosphatase PAP2 family protein [Myxococcus sp.]|nr:phosphatase PAP2 family protein [Myxococcus sp.]